MEPFWTLWWIAGAGVLLFAWPILVVGHLAMTIIDHRRHRSWGTTALAITWPFLCVAMIGVLQGNRSPPLFGVPLLLLFALVWMKTKGLFIGGVLAYYGLSAVVLGTVGLRGGEIHWWFLVFWPVSLAFLISWRMARMSALSRLTVTKS
jgi:hypothetical protein